MTEARRAPGGESMACWLVIEMMDGEMHLMRADGEKELLELLHALQQCITTASELLEA